MPSEVVAGNGARNFEEAPPESAFAVVRDTRASRVLPEMDMQVAVGGRVLDLSSDPADSRPTSALDQITDPNSPFYQMPDELGIFEIENPQELHRRKIMQRADGLARVLTDNMGEKLSIWRHRMTRVATLEVAEEATLAMSVRRDDERTIIWMENANNGKGWMIKDNGVGSVAVSTADIGAEGSVEAATRLIESGGEADAHTQDELFAIIDDFVNRFAKGSGLDPAHLADYATGKKPIPDIVAASERDSQRENIRRKDNGELIMKVAKAGLAATIAIAVVAPISAVVYEGYLIAQEGDRTEAVYDAASSPEFGSDIQIGRELRPADLNLSQPQSAAEAERAMSYARPPAEIFRVDGRGHAVTLHPNEYDVRGVPDAHDTNNGYNHVLEGLYRVEPTFAGEQTCLTVFGKFGGPDVLRTGVFQVGESPRVGLTIETEGTDTMYICKNDGSAFRAGEPVYIWQEQFGPDGLPMP